jgi:hypothetical protein
MQPSEQKGLSGRRLTVWTTEHRGKRFRYVQGANGQLIAWSEYLASMLEREEESERKQRSRTEDSQLKRWARAWKALRALSVDNGNGNGQRSL